MIRQCLPASIASLFCALFVHAQAPATPPSVASYLSRNVFLRSTYRGADLHFDAEGNVTGGSGQQGSFTTAGLNIQKITRHGDTLVVEGRRFGLWTPGKSPAATFEIVPLNAIDRGSFLHRPPAKEKLQISVPGASKDEDFAPALAAIFADDWHAFSESAPAVWQPYFRGKATSIPKGAYRPTDIKSAGSTDEKQRVAEPRLVRSVDPEFTDDARGVARGGVGVYQLVVTPDGLPSNLHIVRPLGLGLDENAIASIEQYRFQAGQMDGKSVPIVMTVEVTFHIY